MKQIFDYAIQNGTVVDGTGTEPFRATVYVRGDRIAAISKDPGLPSRESIDAAGMIVAPGFIDLHTHSDAAPYCAPGFESALSQGVTLQVVGNCGNSLVPNNDRIHATIGKRFSAYYVHPLKTGEEYRAFDLSTYRDELTVQGLAINMASLVGHNTVRKYVMKNPGEAMPTAEELDQMCGMTAKMLDQGAAGLSLGLTYVPGKFSLTEELIALSAEAAKRDRMVAVHMRSETAPYVFQTLDEMARVAKETGAHIHISHLKVMYPVGNDDVRKLLERIDDLNGQGMRITCDQYPYTASSTLMNLIPRWAKLNGNSVSNLRDDAMFEQMQADIDAEIRRRRGSTAIWISDTFGAMSELDGKTLQEAADLLGKSPAEAFREFFIACNGRVNAIYHAMSESDVLEIAARQDIAVGSDGFGYDILSGNGMAGKPHPRSMGTFTRFLRLNREHGLMPLEKAVRKMTGLPAEILGMRERGRLSEGCFADITIFDPEKVKDNATYFQPDLPSEGIRNVFVNGCLAYCDGSYPEKRAGQFLLCK